MIRVLLRPAFYKAILHTLSHPILGPCCRVTGEHVYPRDRIDHENIEHPTDGPCVLL